MKKANRLQGSILKVSVRLLAVVFLCSSCMTAEQAVLKSWEDKHRAITDTDADLYMSTLTESDIYYRNESYAWFWYMANNNFRDLSFTVTGIEDLGPSSVLVHVNQKHSNAGQAFDLNYSIVYRRENGKWLDCDLDFLRREAEGFRLYYMENEKNLETFERFLVTSNRDLTEVFGIGADDNFPVKLYTDRELLRQRTYPVLERQFTAWGEGNESLKVYTGHPMLAPYEGTIRHELVHHITLKMSANRLPSWYAEGLAVHYGNSAVNGGNFIDLGRITRKDARRTVAMLERADVPSMTDEKEIACYYGISGLMVQYIAERWGDDAHIGILEYCGRDGYFDRAKEKDPEAVIQPVLRDAFVHVLGMTAEELSEGYVSWLESRYGFSD